jgi:TP901 family phage tail tape measure protein
MATEVINVVLQLVNNFSKGIDQATSKVDSFKNRVDTLAGAFTPLSIAAGAALGVSTKLAADFDKSIQGAVRGLDLAANEVEGFRKSVRKLSADLQYQFSSTELANIVTEAGKLGVAKSDVDDFAGAMAKVAVATDQKENIEKISSNAAKIASVYKFNTKSIEEYLAAVNKLDDSTSATSNEILNFTQRVSGSASSAKIAGTQIAAFGATLISSGKAPETAATFMNKYLSVLGAATNLSGPAQRALLKIGYSATDLSKRFDKDAIGTMQEFLNRVKQLDTVTQREILGRIFGQEHVGSAQLLVQQTDLLAKSLQEAGNTTGNINKLNSEFDKFAKNSFEGQMNAFNNSLGELGITIGTAILPGLNTLLQTAIIPFVKYISALVDQYPQLSTFIAAFLGISAAIAPFLMLVSAIGGFITAIPILLGGITAVGVGLWAALAPLLPIIAIIGAIAGAAYLIYKNWEPIKGFFTGLWNSAYKSVSDFVSNGINKIVEFGNWVISLDRKFREAAINWGRGLIQGFIDGLQSMYGNIQSAMDNFTKWLRQYLPSSDAKKGALSDLTASGRSMAETFMNGVNSFDLNKGINNQLANRGGVGAGGLQPAPIFSRNSAPPASNNTFNINYTINGGGNDDLVKQLKQRDRDLLDIINKGNQRVNRRTY